MMKTGQNKTRGDTLVLLVLFGVFAVCILSVLLTGADAYGRLSDRDQSSYDRRTAWQYVTTRVRQADRAGGVSLRDFGGVDALVLTEEIDGAAYETLVYCYDGALRELFTEAGGAFAPEDGEEILAAGSMSLRLEGQVLTAELTDSAGEAQAVTLYLRGGEEAAP